MLSHRRNRHISATDQSTNPENRGPINPQLSATPYRADNDREGSTLAYIDAKGAVIAHGGEYGNIPMTSTAARTYTLSIAGHRTTYDGGDFPSPKDAVRLAYFMRELHHDVRCEIVPERNEIWLWVAQGPYGADRLYWAQDLGTGNVLSASEMREASRLRSQTNPPGNSSAIGERSEATGRQISVDMDSSEDNEDEDGDYLDDEAAPRVVMSHLADARSRAVEVVD